MKPSGDQNLRLRRVLHNNIILYRKKINRDVKRFVLDKIIEDKYLHIKFSKKNGAYTNIKIFFTSKT